MTWNPLDQPVDYVMVAGKQTPGIASVEGAALMQRYDERKSYGSSGATLIWRGRALSPFKITIKLLTTDDWDRYETFRTIVEAPPNQRTPRALEVEHPFLKFCGISAMVVQTAHQPEQVEDGVWLIVLDCKEYRAPTPALARPAGTQDSNEPVDPVDREIAALTAQVQDLAR